METWVVLVLVAVCVMVVAALSKTLRDIALFTGGVSLGVVGLLLYQSISGEQFEVAQPDGPYVIDPPKPREPSVYYSKEEAGLNFYDSMNEPSGVFSQLDIESRLNERPVDDGVKDDRVPIGAPMPKFSDTGKIDFSGYEYDRCDPAGSIADNAMMRLSMRSQHRYKENAAYNARRADARRFAYLHQDDLDRLENRNWWEVDQMRQPLDR